MCHWRKHMEATTGYKGGACDNLETLFANVPSPSGGFIFIWLTFLNVYLYICQLFELVFQLFWSSAGRKLLDYVTIFGISNHTVLELENLKISKSDSFIHTFTNASLLPWVWQPQRQVLKMQRHYEMSPDSWHFHSSRKDGRENCWIQ